MKGKCMKSGGATSRDKVMAAAKDEAEGFKKGGAAKKHMKAHGKKAKMRLDKPHRAAGGKVESEAGNTKMRAGQAASSPDREDD